jgi:hypothetical protein
MCLFSVSEGSLIPTVCGLVWDSTFCLGKGDLALPWVDVSCCLVAVAPRFDRQQQLSGSANELGLQNFLTMNVKEL